MAVAHSAASESHTGTTGSTNQASFSWTHTQTGTPQGVVVFVSTYASVTDLITSVTYGGVTLTRLTGGLAQDGTGESGRLDTFFLGSGLGTGNQTITVNRTNNATVLYAAAATVTAGADTAVPTDTIVLLQGDGTLTVQSVDDTSPGVNSLRYAGAYSGLNTPPVAGTGSTLLNSIDIGNYGSALVRETTAGQGARNVGFNNATDDRAVAHLAIRELVPRTETPIVGSFTLTGNDATIAKGWVMEGGTGAFTLTGNPADLRRNANTEGGTGAFTLNGNPVTFKYAKARPRVGKFFLPERNRHQWSEDFDNAYWTKNNSSITANATAAPGTTLTADLLLENTASLASHNIAASVTFETGKFYTVSCYAKAYTAAQRNIRLRLGDATIFSDDTCVILTFGPPVNSIAVVGTGASGDGTSLGDGWFRVRVTRQYTGPGITTTIPIVSLRQGNSDNYTGTGLSGAYIWGIQFEEANAVSTYDPTGPASATPASFSRQYKLRGETGTFSLTGNAADLTITGPKVIEPVVGTFTLTGNPATLSKTNSLEAERGLFTLTGSAPELRKGYRLSVDVGTFSLTGNSATFSRTWNVSAVRGQFILTGEPAALTEIGAFEIDPILGTFALTGNDATFAKSSALQAARGIFTLTGQTATLTTGLALQSDPGTFTLTGNPVTFSENRVLPVTAGNFTLTGNPATLSALNNYALAVDTGQFALTGNPATLSALGTLELNADVGQFLLIGNAAGMRTGRSILAATGSFALNGGSINVNISPNLIGTIGAFALTGNPAILAKSGIIGRRRNVLIF